MDRGCVEEWALGRCLGGTLAAFCEHRELCTRQEDGLGPLSVELGDHLRLMCDGGPFDPPLTELFKDDSMELRPGCLLVHHNFDAMGTETEKKE